MLLNTAALSWSTPECRGYYAALPCGISADQDLSTLLSKLLKAADVLDLVQWKIASGTLERTNFWHPSSSAFHAGAERRAQGNPVLQEEQSYTYQ